MNSILPEDVRNLLTDLEIFVLDILKGENLSKKAKDKKDLLIKKIKDLKQNYPNEFQEKSEAEDLEDNDGISQPHDTVSLASDRDKDDELPSDGNIYPPTAAQDLQRVSKAGYLEKRRKGHSVFGSEWQKRWCAMSNFIFYYYGSDKDKQQKGEFSLDGYRARMNNTLRKDAKKDCCFEIFAPDKRIYQFTASTAKEAEEWVNAVLFLNDSEGDELYDDVKQDNSPNTSFEIHPDKHDGEDIYEELPEEANNPTNAAEPEPPKAKPISPPINALGKEDNDYANYYRGLWDCTGDHTDELSFKHGDVIYIISKEYNRYGWWVGEMKGTIGLVPKAYIMEMYDI
ncbi:src kinase-associated phosphoprotein 2 [Bombina bombina]|uniref:src kinase-associated phosphoprotein 2 n=1 Tax=Bombina bombina TaxID=8345 RepID=UPI00235B0CEC|nr:src kinase-associated phosphoprotein 2 [Bombina bombina]